MQVSYATAGLLSRYKDVFDFVFVLPYKQLSGSQTNAQFVSSRRRSTSIILAMADENNAKLRGYIVMNLYEYAYSALPVSVLDCPSG